MPPNNIAHITIPPHSSGFELPQFFLTLWVVPGVGQNGDFLAPGSSSQIRPGRVSWGAWDMRSWEVELHPTGNADHTGHFAGSQTSKEHCEQHGSTQFRWFGILAARLHRFTGGRVHPFWPILTVFGKSSPGAPDLQRRASENIQNASV